MRKRAKYNSYDMWMRYAVWNVEKKCWLPAANKYNSKASGGTWVDLQEWNEPKLFLTKKSAQNALTAFLRGKARLKRDFRKESDGFISENRLTYIPQSDRGVKEDYKIIPIRLVPFL